MRSFHLCLHTGKLHRTALWKPLVHIGSLVGEVENSLGIGRHGDNSLSVGIRQRPLHLITTPLLFTKDTQLRIDLQQPTGQIGGFLISGCLLRDGTHGKVAQLDVGGAIEHDLPMYAAEAPEVLILKVAAITILVHFHSDVIAAGLEIARHVKLARFHRPLTIPHLLAIKPHIECTLHTLESQKHLPAGHVSARDRHPVFGQLERAAILSCGIALLECSPVCRRFGHHVRRIDAKRVACGDVNRCAVAVKLPGGRHLQFFPCGAIVVGPIEIHNAFGRGLRPPEFPNAVK